MNTTENKITIRIPGNTTMVGVNVSELRRAYGATEASRICVSCDASFLPTDGDLCARCEQRQSDRLAGAKLSAWVMAALIFTLLAVAQRMRGSCVDDALLNRVAWVESRNNPRAVGKLDERGAYQLRPIAIREVNRIHGTSYTIHDATTPKAREIARLYLLICESRCRVKTPESVYAKYRGKR